MKAITFEVLSNIQGTVEKTGDGEWRVTSEYGRVIDISEKNGIDFQQCLTPCLPGETEDNREVTYFETIDTAEQIWGVVDVRKLPFWTSCKVEGYAKAYERPVDNNRYRPFGVSDAIEAFGDETKVRNSWFPAGWRITSPEGELVIGKSGNDLTLKDVSGSPKTFKDGIALLVKRQGYVVVSSSKKSFLILMISMVESAKEKCIPELYPTLTSQFVKVEAIGMIVFVIALGVMLSYNYSIWVPIGITWFVTIIVGVLLDLTGEKSARKKGSALLNKFPPVHDGQRQADHDEAQRKGWIL